MGFYHGSNGAFAVERWNVCFLPGDHPSERVLAHISITAAYFKVIATAIKILVLVESFHRGHPSHLWIGLHRIHDERVECDVYIVEEARAVLQIRADS